MPKVVIASYHPAEIAEIAEMLKTLGWTGAAARNAGLSAAFEGKSHREQALGRARAFADIEGEAALAVATSLGVYALDQAPGLLTHTYAGANATDSEHRAKLLKALARVPAGQRIALFHAAVAVVFPGGNELAASATLECAITTAERGEGGYLYDAVVQVVDGRTLAEMPDEDRFRLSHRAMAVGQVLRRLA